MIKIIFLGTSDAIPSAERNHTSILLNYKNENILVDCGEGTQRQFRKAKLNLCKITRILITHWHGDHVLGIPGLLQTLSFSGYNKPLFIYGPKGTKEFMSNMLKTFLFQEKIKLSINEVEGKFLETGDFYIEAEKMRHGIPCNAYTFVRKSAVRIDKDKLKKTKLQGPILKKIKEGKDVIYEGKKYLAKNLTYGEKEKKISFVFDTSFNEGIIPFVRNSDLLICESTFGEELEDKADRYKHLTAKQTALIAKKSKSKKLVLTHISQRYNKNPNKILNVAKKIFKNSVLAKDLDVIEV
ncbi:ribonuclease Z [Candidatus Pacearchaeota archaeon RBG_19FT_COMBO_34_9]|nr:MAG: ribonuclease Z [Candidatus Pacearchaeota archaeon RBG_19FT_COMBO_34_9]OGJ16537.1 MAG: ribonuclease Z [Candidatus Pacearchaeota archaeon RBG_13_33_26]